MPSILWDLPLSVEEDFRLLLQLALLTLLLMIFLYPLDAGRFNSRFSFESPSPSASLAAFRPQSPRIPCYRSFSSPLCGCQGAR